MNMMSRFHPASGWTPENVAVLTRMWLDGFSAPDIARALGHWCNKNKVIGKARRLGLGEHANARNRANVKPRRKSVQRRKPSLAPVIAAKPVPATPEPPVVVVIPFNPPGKPISIIQATDRSCRFPVNESATTGGHLFCGADTFDGAVYCVHHQRAAYTPVPERQKIFASR